MYPEVSLFIDGEWGDGTQRRREPVLNPATEEIVGHVAYADQTDLDRALAAADAGFLIWRRTSAQERYVILRKAAAVLRERQEVIAKLLTLEQGKPLAEAMSEISIGVELIDWFAEEGRRTYGRVVPSRVHNVQQVVIKEPVGPVAAFTPWNFPINQAVRKLAAALAAGCSIILKGPEETPASCAELVRAFESAGVPRGIVNLVFGVPAEISSYLIAHPIIRKITFTGSTAVGKVLAGLAGQHMKRITMELGGHAPVIIFADADIETALKLLTAAKYRNAGQSCVSPTRFLVHEAVYERFVQQFSLMARELRVSDGLDPKTQMGPLANHRRRAAMEAYVADATEKGGRVRVGGKRLHRRGYFFEPTVLTDMSLAARVMNEEPFGPLALMIPFDSFESAIAEANRLPYGLAAYAYTRSLKTAGELAEAIETGMISINHHGLALPELHFGGVKDSGYGTEGGSEAIEAYLSSKLITQMQL